MATSTAFALAFLSALASASSPLILSRLEMFPTPVASPEIISDNVPTVPSGLPLAPIAPIASNFEPEFSTKIAANSSQAPQSGGQLYVQRLAALQIGKLYTRLPSDSFAEIWRGAALQPTYQQWRNLLAQESKAVSKRSSDRDLAILLGDSLSLWFPCDRLQSSRIWLNQGISGDTTWNILARLSDLVETRPSEIYLMAGVNDLKMGATDAEIVWNIQRIITKLQEMHPNARIIVESILPTRSHRIPHDRIAGINAQLKAIAQRASASYLDLYSEFVDQDGQILSEYTTDGIHLSAQGYAAWQSVFQESGSKIAALPISN
ncbi:GDSL-type esterase/lipase family protein [Leptolyngbya sp. DQ-M1]|uniref:GDSL-type esterase/lipase family protein n=1 Tax=Leptolyngbya sp. DQ-M1 TaxID=2933920 RepID=UPI0032995CFA